jgi:hypothetical protein
MKKIFLPVLCIAISHQVFANDFYDQLGAFNFNWKKYDHRLPAGEARSFYSDKDYIQAHLDNVLFILRTNPVDQFNAKQYCSRIKLLALLEDYSNTGKFPINYERHERIPVFIDRNNIHCAVGYLLQKTGYEKTARAISVKDNYAWVKDIHEADLLSWQLASGFTLEELKLIQGAYDFYMPNALILPNKFEIPQRPACMTRYFVSNSPGSDNAKKASNIWCQGEGEHGILNGRWEQNYAINMPWILGYYEHGKRSGQWLEYYQGTRLVCRTEHWSHDTLNGIRKRFDRQGNLIEEILFKKGVAITKINYDMQDSLVWVRKPIDSMLVWTEAFSLRGNLVARGHERVYNPGKLLWFQNIELTALNSISIASRDISFSQPIRFRRGGQAAPFIGTATLYNAPPLVQYKKEGDWQYYKECEPNYLICRPAHSYRELFCHNYPHFGAALFQSIGIFGDLEIRSGYDSIRVTFSNDLLQDFYGYSPFDFAHLQIRYYEFIHPVPAVFNSRIGIINETGPFIKSIGQYNRDNLKIGLWKFYDRMSRLSKMEYFLIPQKEEGVPIDLKPGLPMSSVLQDEQGRRYAGAR